MSIDIEILFFLFFSFPLSVFGDRARSSGADPEKETGAPREKWRHACKGLSRFGIADSRSLPFLSFSLRPLMTFLLPTSSLSLLPIISFFSQGSTCIVLRHECMDICVWAPTLLQPYESSYPSLPRNDLSSVN